MQGSDFGHLIANCWICSLKVFAPSTQLLFLGYKEVVEAGESILLRSCRNRKVRMGQCFI